MFNTPLIRSINKKGIELGGPGPGAGVSGEKIGKKLNEKRHHLPKFPSVTEVSINAFCVASAPDANRFDGQHPSVGDGVRALMFLNVVPTSSFAEWPWSHV